MTTYTLNHYNSDNATSGLSLVDAAVERLYHDGGEYQVVPKDGLGWELQVRKPNSGRREWNMCWDGPSPHGKPIWETGSTEDEAFALMAVRVISAHWNDGISITTDAEYEAMLAEIERENQL